MFRLDFAYPRLRVAIEYDGEEFHLTTEDQFRRDERRRQLLRDAGWTVLTVRAGDFSSALAGAWVDRVAELLRHHHDTRRW